MNQPLRKLTIILSFSGTGGVERMVLNLLPGLIEHACGPLCIDLVAIRAERFRGTLPDEVNFVDLGLRHSSTAAPTLARYLRQSSPDAILAAKDRAIRSAALARRLASSQAMLVGRLGTNLTASLQGHSGLSRWLRYQPMRWIYPKVDRIVAVSEGVAEDTRLITRLPSRRITVVRNPVVTPALTEQAAVPVAHRWLEQSSVPVVMGAGRLTRQKDFKTLLQAFARLRANRPARLIILGEGGEREALIALSRELGVAEDVDLPGYVDNPYAWLSRASLFVLSSAWEGSPNVLTEAVALGVPVVATDCPSGPRELLKNGKYGPLVSVGDSVAMAEAMATTLDRPLSAATLCEAASEYTVEASAKGYLEALGLG